MTMTDNRNEIAMKEFPIEQCAAQFLHSGYASFFILIPPFDLNNPRSILKDDCVDGCRFQVGRDRREWCCPLEPWRSSNACKAPVLIDSGIQRNGRRQRLSSGRPGGDGLGVRRFMAWPPRVKLGSARCCAF